MKNFEEKMEMELIDRPRKRLVRTLEEKFRLYATKEEQDKLKEKMDLYTELE